MNLADRLQRLADALPSEAASVMLSKRDLLDMLDGAGPECAAARSSQEPLMDLSVQDVMDATGRARSTVIGWINASKLEAYKFNNREWRIPRDAWRQFQRRQQGASDAPQASMEDSELSSWRRELSHAGGRS